MRRVARIKRGKRRRSRSNAWLPAPHPATTTYCLLGWCCIPFDCSTLGMARVETDLNTQKCKKSIKQTKYHPQNPSLISIFTTQVISLVLCTESIQAPCASCTCNKIWFVLCKARQSGAGQITSQQPGLSPLIIEGTWIF